jgi:RNA polymerase sigma factor FliA
VSSRTARDDSGEEEALWSSLRTGSCPEARARLFDLYSPMARRIAARHYRSGSPSTVCFPELAQLAYAGLLEAIDRFRPELGVPFRFFGGRRIGGSILDGIARHSEVNRQISHRRRTTRERLASIVPGSATDPNRGSALDVIGDIAAGLAIGLMLDDCRLYVADERDPAHDAFDAMSWRQTLALLTGQVAQLPEREGLVIRYHYLEGLSFEQVAAMMGLSKGRISQIHKQAMERLLKRLAPQVRTASG